MTRSTCVSVPLVSVDGTAPEAERVDSERRTPPTRKSRTPRLDTGPVRAVRGYCHESHRAVLSLRDGASNTITARTASPSRKDTLSSPNAARAWATGFHVHAASHGPGAPLVSERGAWGTAPGFAPWRAMHHSEPAATLAASPGRRRRSQQP